MEEINKKTLSEYLSKNEVAELLQINPEKLLGQNLQLHMLWKKIDAEYPHAAENPITTESRREPFIQVTIRTGSEYTLKGRVKIEVKQFRGEIKVKNTELEKIVDLLHVPRDIIKAALSESEKPELILHPLEAHIFPISVGHILNLGDSKYRTWIHENLSELGIEVRGGTKRFDLVAEKTGLNPEEFKDLLKKETILEQDDARIALAFMKPETTNKSGELLIGNILREYRNQRSVNGQRCINKDLAEKSGVPLYKLRLIIKNQRRPNEQDLRNLCPILGIKPETRDELINYVKSSYVNTGRFGSKADPNSRSLN